MLSICVYSASTVKDVPSELMGTLLKPVELAASACLAPRALLSASSAAARSLLRADTAGGVASSTACRDAGSASRFGALSAARSVASSKTSRPSSSIAAAGG